MKCQLINTPYVPIGSGLPRSNTPGKPHLTDVMQSIQKDLGTEYKGKGFQDRYLTMDLGFVWEDLLSYIYSERSAHRIEEVEFQNIVGSPDGINDYDNVVAESPLLATPQDLCLEEYKLTWKSTRSHPRDDWKYMTQIKSYLRMISGLYEMEITCCIMRIIYVNGDYKGSGPIYRIGWFNFEWEEIEENWAMIYNHAKEKGMFNI